jgi:hypothetical protein
MNYFYVLHIFLKSMNRHYQMVHNRLFIVYAIDIGQLVRIILVLSFALITKVFSLLYACMLFFRFSRINYFPIYFFSVDTDFYSERMTMEDHCR